MNQQMYQQQQFGGLGGAMPYGYQPQQNPNPPKYTQPLTPEEIASLKVNREAFTLGMTQEEMLRSICFHRDEQKRETLRPNADGTVTCLLCGKTFYPSLDLDESTVVKATTDIEDILQTTKLLYLDMPEEAARDYYQIIALIDKLPKLYKLASDNFVKHENWNSMRFSYGPTTQDLYNTITGSYGFNAAPTQPMYGGYAQPQPQPMYGGYAQPQQPMYGAAPMPGSNGFGYNGPAPMPAPQGYMPNTAGYQYNPTQQPMLQSPQDATAAQAAPAATETKVDQQFSK